LTGRSGDGKIGGAVGGRPPDRARAGEDAISIWDDIGGAISDAADAVGGAVEDAVNAVEEVVTDVVETVGNAISDGLGAIGDFLGGIRSRCRAGFIMTKDTRRHG
jgi:hypothetical protein